MYYFCTYFDHRYLPKGLALYQSLVAHCKSFKLWILCLDRECYDVLTMLRLPFVELIAMDHFEKADAVITGTKCNRTRVEYYFTITPALPLFVLEHWQHVDVITYLDSDLYFFSDPSPIFSELGNDAIAIIPHRSRAAGFERFGIYNVGWISFRRHESAIACLRWWRERCIEWCHDYPEEGRYAEQRYLDVWPSLFSGVVVIGHRGANVALWNLYGASMQFRDGHLWIDGSQLIFYHYSGLRQISRRMFRTHARQFGIRLPLVVRKYIYRPYIRRVLKVSRELASIIGDIDTYSTVAEVSEALHPERNDCGMTAISGQVRQLVHLTKGIAIGQYMIVSGGCVL